MKKRRKTNKDNPNSRYWKTKADDAWRAEIRAVGSCEICGHKTGLNAHHLIGRTNLLFRHDLSNGVCLCSGCHLFKDHSPHRDLISTDNFILWLKAERPGQWQWYKENKDNKRLRELTYRDSYEAITKG